MIQAFGHLDPHQLTPLMPGALLARWLHGHKRSTAYAKRIQLQKALAILSEAGAPPIRLAKIAKPEPRATTAKPAELVALFQSPPPWLRLFMLLYLQCGLRRAETLRVTPRSWDRQKHTVTIQVKGHRIRRAELTPDVERLLASVDESLIDAETPYICALHGRPITAHGLNRAWWRHKQACGVSAQLVTHDLRRTAATILYEATKDLRIAQQLLGHKNLASTLEYLAPLEPNEARKYTELLNFSRFHSETKQ